MNLLNQHTQPLLRDWLNVDDVLTNKYIQVWQCNQHHVAETLKGSQLKLKNGAKLEVKLIQFAEDESWNIINFIC